MWPKIKQSGTYTYNRYCDQSIERLRIEISANSPWISYEGTHGSRTSCRSVVMWGGGVRGASEDRQVVCGGAMSNVENVCPQVLRGVTRELRRLAANPPAGVKLVLRDDDLTDVLAHIDGPGQCSRLLHPITLHSTRFLCCTLDSLCPTRIQPLFFQL